jgi:hypothetical protein
MIAYSPLSLTYFAYGSTFRQKLMLPNRPSERPAAYHSLLALLPLWRQIWEVMYGDDHCFRQRAKFATSTAISRLTVG